MSAPPRKNIPPAPNNSGLSAGRNYSSRMASDWSGLLWSRTTFHLDTSKLLAAWAESQAIGPTDPSGSHVRSPRLASGRPTPISGQMNPAGSEPAVPRFPFGGGGNPATIPRACRHVGFTQVHPVGPEHLQPRPVDSSGFEPLPPSQSRFTGGLVEASTRPCFPRDASR